VERLPAVRRTLGPVTMPEPTDEREAGPLGSEVAPPGDEESQGGPDGVAGPSYPPAETEPDAHRD
jgi:hypothetical protein